MVRFAGTTCQELLLTATHLALGRRNLRKRPAGTGKCTHEPVVVPSRFEEGESVSFAIGQKVGRYRIEEEIGAGGMGVVYRGYDNKLKREIAIKVLAPGTLDDPASRKRFRNEALILSRLNHPSIQTIYDFDTIEGHDFLISEFVRGTSLDIRTRSGPLTEKEVTGLGLQLAEGLSSAHAAGVLHRDLKPANLRIMADDRLKILDFGLATLSHVATATLSTASGSFAEIPSGMSGTLPYMPPEQLLGEAVDERSDIYSAGVVLFELSTGRLPFTSALVPKLINAIIHETPTAPRTLVPQVSDELQRIVLKCMEKKPELRYQSAKELASDLRYLGNKSSTQPALQPIEKMDRRWPKAVIVVGVSAMVAATVLLYFHFTINSRAAAPNLRWERLTNFDDAAEAPAVSSDGKLIAFLRGPGSFGSSVNAGQLWLKPLPNGEPIQLTRTTLRKQTISFSRDSNKLYFTQVEGPFAWNTYEMPLLGGQEPKLFMPNATGLSWTANDRVLYSTIESGIHMKLATSNSSRTDERDVYVPRDAQQGMVHRSALSPDGKWVLAVEMDSEWWKQCRLLPFDGSSEGQSVGPEGSCTAAQWSPDGKWMYFTVDTRADGSHIWRQSFPDGIPQQLTPSGASEEEGLAVMPDGRSLITAAGTQQSAIWVHDAKTGDRQVTSEGYCYLPTFSPDGSKVYFLRRAAGSHSYFSGELWVSDLTNGNTQHLFPDLLLTHFSISQDGKKVAFATEQGRARSGIWIAWLDRTQPPRQLTFNGEYRVFFGRPGQLLFQGRQSVSKIMSINEDGASETPASSVDIMQLQNVSPDGRWALIGVTPQGGHGDTNVTIMVVPLAGGTPLSLCDKCAFGFGTVRSSPPLISWSPDGQWIYVPLRSFTFGSSKTAAIPVKPGSPPPSFTSGFDSEADFARIPGAHLIDQNNIFPSTSPGYFVTARHSAKANLFRIYLPK
jgi:serine/threonine protein kinase